MRLNIWIPTFDDLDQLEHALDSIVLYNDLSRGVTIHVVDGRYATFEGDHDVTRGIKPLCQEYECVEARCPPDLPLGDPEAPGSLRSPQHEQAKWVNYEMLPQDEWALEMDTDERLDQLDLDALADLDPKKKYTPQVITPDGEQLLPAVRLYQPRYWTFWIDDVMFWRNFYPRSTPVEELVEAHVQTAHRNTCYGGETEAIVLRNLGAQRPEEYQERRADQLETMGSKWAARAVRDGEYPSTVDLTEYAREEEDPFST